MSKTTSGLGGWKGGGICSAHTADKRVSLSEITVSLFIELSFVITRLWLENTNVERVFEINSRSQRIDFAVAPVQRLHEIPC